MSTALTKAIRRTDAVAAAAYDLGARRKAAGLSLDFTPSMPLAGMTSWQEQQVYQERYVMMTEWVYSAVNALASEGAGQPAVVARLAGSKASKVKPKGRKLLELNRMTRFARVKAATTEYEIQEDHPLVDLLGHPNPMQEKWQFVYSFLANLVLTGWAYVVYSWNKREKRPELYSLPSTWVTPVHEKGLFAEFEVKNPKAVGVEPVWLDRSQVGFAMLPNPGDPLAALAPSSSQLRTLRMHEHMLNGQEAFFRNGIFPSVVVVMSPVKDYMGTDRRPVLAGSQRRMIYQALRQNVMGDMNQGTAFIVDGLIDDIKPFSLTNREMGWDKAEEKIKSRILSAFSVHEFILGGVVTVGGYAQAEIIEGRFYKRVNTYLDMLSTLLSNLLGGFDGDERLLVWFEECQASNPERRNSTLLSMRASNDISQNELRAEMGFGPDEDLNQAAIQPSVMGEIGQVIGFLSSGAIQRDQAVALLEGIGVETGLASKIVGKAKKGAVEVKEENRSMLLNSVGGMTGTVAVLTGVGQGLFGREEAANMLTLFLQVSKDEALAMVPEPPPPPEVPPETQPPPQPPLGAPGEPQEPEGEGEGESMGEEEEGVQEAVEELKTANLLLAKALEEPERQADRILKSVDKDWSQQPRVPAGNPEGGEFGPGGGGGSGGTWQPSSSGGRGSWQKPGEGEGRGTGSREESRGISGMEHSPKLKDDEFDEWAGKNGYYASVAADAISGGNAKGIVERVGGKTVAISAYKEFKDEGMVEIKFLASNQKGSGTKMIAEVCRVASSKGMGLSLFADPAAVGFYKKMGMTHEGEGVYSFSKEQAKGFYDQYQARSKG